MLKTINELLNDVRTISESYDRVAAVTGENFNIFSILRMESDEVATHSRFIAELLDRNGSHGLKDEFLTLFINRFADNQNFNADRSHIITEYYIGRVEEDIGGRIDIFIKDDEGNVILIENKIYAGEQHKQLIRYRNAFPNAKLFYLTLFGDSSVDEDSDINYQTLSYEMDIIGWLEECRKISVNIPIVRESISQYIFLLKKITNQNTNKRMSEDIVSRLLEDRGRMQSYKVLYDVCKDLKKELVKRIVEQSLKPKLENHGFLNIKTMDFRKDHDLLISFQIEALQQQNLCVRLNFERSGYSNLILGFYDVNESLQHNSLFLDFQQKFAKAKSTKLYPAYIYYDEFRNWHLNVLEKIYFDFEAFYTDLKMKLDVMLVIVDSVSDRGDSVRKR